MGAPVTFTATEIPAVQDVESAVFSDERGFFTEVYSKRNWEAAGFTETFLQDNLSLSARGTVRGMHYQLDPHGMGKLVRVIKGSAFDVAVDLREGSPTFGQWVGRTLSGDNKLALWVPSGFAHGFLALEDDTVFFYKCTGVYTPEAERSLRFDDPDVGIEWPFQPTSISPKDQAAPLLKDAEYNFVYSG